jgi:hypothetical protein
MIVPIVTTLFLCNQVSPDCAGPGLQGQGLARANPIMRITGGEWFTEGRGSQQEGKFYN